VRDHVIVIQSVLIAEFKRQKNKSPRAKHGSHLGGQQLSVSLRPTPDIICSEADEKLFVAFSSRVKLLGVTLDEDLSRDLHHVTDIVRGCSCHTRALSHIHPLINLSPARMVAKGVVTSRLDYCSGLLYGTSIRNVERLQVSQNSLARAAYQAT